MRFTPVSVALLALAHSVAPGVHGAPVVAPDHMNSLAVRQDIATLVSSLLSSVLGDVTSLLGGQGTVSLQTLQQIVQELQSSLAAAGSLLPRAPPSSDATSPASLTTLSSTKTATSIGLATSTASNPSSVSSSTPQASSKPPTGMRRQLPTAVLLSVLSAVPSIVGSQSALQPVLSAVPSKPDSLTSKPVASKPTSSKPSSSASQV